MWGHVFWLLLLGVALHQRHLFQAEHNVERSLNYDHDKFFRNQRGLLVHYAELGKRPANPKGVVIIVHGYCEHHLYYEDLAKQLNGIGLAAFALDHVGHGRSEGERSYVENIEHLANDVLFLAKLASQRVNPKLPVMLYGHSMGGMVSIFAAYKDATQHPEGGLIKSTVLESPLVKIHPNSGSPLQQFFGKLLSHIPKLRLPGAKLDRDLLTRDAKLKERWATDPLRIEGNIFTGTAGSFIRGAERIDELLDAKKIRFPFFMAFGEDDYACDPAAGIDFYNRAGTPADLKQLRTYKGGYHTMKYDPISEQYHRDVLDWYKKFL